MKIFPAIDLKDGKAVRLFQGDYDQMTVYSENPVEIAKSFKKQGASNLHLVDLDGAKDGKLVNFDTIKEIVNGVSMFVQVGGGIRDEKRITQYLELGVGRVILGTVAVKDFDFLCDMVKKYGDKIAVSVDVKDGHVAINGWKELTDIKGYEFCVKLRDASVKTIIYTDISKDGAMQGTNMDAYEKLSKIEKLDIVASGGVSFEHEIKELKSKGIYGAILGKAIYSGMLNLAEVINIARNQ